MFAVTQTPLPFVRIRSYFDGLSLPLNASVIIECPLRNFDIRKGSVLGRDVV